MKRPIRFFSYFICVTLIASMFSFAPGVFAAEKDAAKESAASDRETVSQPADLQETKEMPGLQKAAPLSEPADPTNPTIPTDPTDPTEPPAKKYCKITVSQTSGGIVTVDQTSVEQGAATTIHITAQ